MDERTFNRFFFGVFGLIVGFWITILVLLILVLHHFHII